MLNLFVLNKKDKNIKYIDNKTKISNTNKINNWKYYPVSTREWNNSIYSFNKNTLSLIPWSSKLSSKLITNYLKSWNLNIKYKLPNTYLTRKQKRLTSNRIYISNGEFKHTNDKVIIVLYTYNREKYNYLYFLNKYIFLKKNKFLNKKFCLIKNRSLNYLKKIDTNKYNVIKKIKKNNINYYVINFYKNWIKKSMKIIKLYLYMKQLLYINNSKYNYTYLQILKNYIEKIYNKKVEFNLINIKYFYMNSDILLKSVTLKITKNRIKHKWYMGKPTWKIEAFKNKYNNIDISENLLKRKIKLETYLKQKVLETIKYKRVSGTRLQVAGRLTRRITASRSIKKIKYKGSLKYNNLSDKKISTIILKGNLRSNVQYTKLKSVTRIGSFGIKGWIGGN